jgi:hypothetical protein
MYYHILFFHFSLHKHLGCSHLSAVVNNAAINMCVKYLFETLLSVVDPRSEIPRMNANSVFNFIFFW